MLPGPQLDAEVDRHVFGREIAGVVPCVPWQGGGGWHVEWRNLSHGTPRPVYVDCCACDHYADAPEHMTGPRILGHFWACFAVTEPYSTTWDGAGLVVERLHARRFRLIGLQEHWTDADWECVIDGWRAGRGMFHERGTTAPHAICLTAVSAVTDALLLAPGGREGGEGEKA